jgi:hypothetical protein
MGISNLPEVSEAPINRFMRLDDGFFRAHYSQRDVESFFLANLFCPSRALAFGLYYRP